MSGILILVCFNLLFFYRLYSNPFQMATSELLSTFFPTWLWQGRMWSKWKIPKYEPCYWLNAHSHPVLSTYYPFQIASSFLSARIRNWRSDECFNFYVIIIFTHYFVCSFLWFNLLTCYSLPIALLGAITLTYGAYSVKQTPCLVYTLAWFPLALYYNPLLASIGIGMMLLAGYYPFAFYLIPLAIGARFLWYHDLWSVCGILIGLPQLIAFFRYLPKTIKAIKSTSVEVGFWEKHFYIGIAPLFFALFSTSRVWIVFCLSLLFALGLFKKHMPRVHQRWLIVTQFSLAWMAINGLYNLNLPAISLWLIFILQSFDLWHHNSTLIPTRPYCELYQKPYLTSKCSLVKYLESHLGKDERVSGLPFPMFTGILYGFKTIGYCGGMQLKLMAKWRNDKNPNGSGEHDFFRSNTDDGQLTKQRVSFAYSRKRINWLHTPIRKLYRNPDYGPVCSHRP